MSPLCIERFLRSNPVVIYWSSWLSESSGINYEGKYFQAPNRLWSMMEVLRLSFYKASTNSKRVNYYTCGYEPWCQSLCCSCFRCYIATSTNLILIACPSGQLFPKSTCLHEWLLPTFSYLVVTVAVVWAFNVSGLFSPLTTILSSALVGVIFYLTPDHQAGDSSNGIAQ